MQSEEKEKRRRESQGAKRIYLAEEGHYSERALWVESIPSLDIELLRNKKRTLFVTATTTHIRMRKGDVKFTANS